MLKAEYADHTRKCLRRWESNHYFLRHVALKNIFNWKNSNLTFHSPISVVTGRNGTGKSTLVNSIKHIYDLQNGSHDMGIFSMLEDYSIEFVNQVNEKIIVKNRELVSEEFRFPTLIDLTFNSNDYSFFKLNTDEQRETYKETLKAFDQIPLEGELLDILKDLIEKPIVSSFKIIDEDQNDRIYYSLELDDGTIYDSFSMGSGEFYILQFLWGLKSLKEKSFGIIEEMENYVHPLAQKKMLELLHCFCGTKNIQFLLTTHSTVLIDHLDQNSICLLKNFNSNIITIEKCPPWLAKDTLGKDIENKIIVFLEDRKAITLFKNIISQHDRELLHQLNISNAQGSGNIYKIVSMCNQFNIQKVIGIVDGDDSQPEEKFLIKLPGELPPEKLILPCILANSKTLSEMIKKPEAEIVHAFSSANHIHEYHEWISTISYTLGEDPNYLWSTLTKIWCQENQECSRQFYEKFGTLFAAARK